MTWESTSYREYFTRVSDKFSKETADYLAFMKSRHKIVTLDYIAKIEHDNQMKDSRIEHLVKLLKERGVENP